jgi:hypothetical protein
MHQSIENLKSTTFRGRRFTRKQIVEIKSTVCNFTKLSRRELANTVCEHLGWFTPTGENRSQACLNALEQMEAAIYLHYQPKLNIRLSAIGNLFRIQNTLMNKLLSTTNLSLYSPFNLYQSLNRMSESCGMNMSTDTII